MAQVRALTTLFCDGILRNAGDVFEYDDDKAKALKGDPSEGMEVVNKKNTAAYQKAQAEAHQALVDKATALRKACDDLKAQLAANPTQGDLVQKVLDADTAATDAEKAVDADTAANGDGLV